MGKAGTNIRCWDSARLAKAALAFMFAALLATMTACSCSSDSAREPVQPDPSPPSSPSGSSSDVSDDLDGIVRDSKELYDKGVAAISDFVERRENAVPGHFGIGEMAAATKNLAVGVMAIEPGPYDHRDGTPTTRVVVSMANTSDEVVTVKASNWNADTKSGLRVDHKHAVYSEGGEKVAESFTLANVSPEATYTAELYFDGELVDVLYEPHWLISAQNEYLYWDVV